MSRAPHILLALRGAACARRAAAVLMSAALLVTCGALAAAQPSVVGQWDGPFSWPFAASHAALLPDGRVLVWSDPGDLPQIWDPGTGGFTSAASPDTLAPGAAQVQLANGDIAVLGGRDGLGNGVVGALRYQAGGNTW
ncbi:MAG: hypothetical protein ACE5G2_03945, partial [Candidatus Krumholzibacteriia bacterium]